jgi:hypothetical protein
MTRRQTPAALGMTALLRRTWEWPARAIAAGAYRAEGICTIGRYQDRRIGRRDRDGKRLGAGASASKQRQRQRESGR